MDRLVGPAHDPICFRRDDIRGDRVSRTNVGYPEHLSREGTAWAPSIAPKGSGADWDNARQWFAERQPQEWLALFDADPAVLHQMLGDVFRAVRAEEEAKAGTPRIGRRPKAISGSLDELRAMVTPRYSMDPFPVAVQVLIDEAPSLRAFAKRSGIHYQTIQKMIRGDARLDMWRLEKIAAAGGTVPAYFREWREAHVLTTIASVLAARPNLGIQLSRRIVELQAINGRSRSRG